MVCIKIPRRDTNEVGEYEVTVTSELHAQAERTKKQKREDKAASSGGSDKDPEPGHRMMVLEQGGAPLVAVRFLGTVPETDLLVVTHKRNVCWGYKRNICWASARFWTLSSLSMSSQTAGRACAVRAESWRKLALAWQIRSVLFLSMFASALVCVFFVVAAALDRALVCCTLQVIRTQDNPRSQLLTTRLPVDTAVPEGSYLGSRCLQGLLRPVFLKAGFPSMAPIPCKRPMGLCWDRTCFALLRVPWWRRQHEKHFPFLLPS